MKRAENDFLKRLKISEKPAVNPTCWRIVTNTQ
jgi:hypothetical protein